jgi:hypothetical protein
MLATWVAIRQYMERGRQLQILSIQYFLWAGVEVGQLIYVLFHMEFATWPRHFADEAQLQTPRKIKFPVNFAVNERIHRLIKAGDSNGN